MTHIHKTVISVSVEALRLCCMLSNQSHAQQALQAELEERSAALAAAQADALAAGKAAEEVERLQAQLERLGAERDDLAAALDSTQQVCAHIAAVLIMQYSRYTG